MKNPRHTMSVGSPAPEAAQVRAMALRVRRDLYEPSGTAAAALPLSA